MQIPAGCLKPAVILMEELVSSGHSRYKPSAEVKLGLGAATPAAAAAAAAAARTDWNAHNTHLCPQPLCQIINDILSQKYLKYNMKYPLIL